MPTIREIAGQYGVSKSTARRWIKDCLPDVFNGERVNLDEAQMHRLAHFIAERELASIRDDSDSNGSRIIQITDDGAVSESLMERIRELEIENASLRAVNDSLERSNELLLERLRVADEALEREQMQARGFWSRLGQKLLGDGREK